MELKVRPLSKYISSSLLSLSVILVSACGSSGGGSTSTSFTEFDGNTSPASINESNAQSIGESAGESIQKADNSNLPTGILINEDIDIKVISDLIVSGTQQVDIFNLPAGATIDASEACSSGSASMGYPDSFTGNGAVDFVYSYTNCRVGSYTFNGKAKAHFNNFPITSFGYTFNYINFVVTDNYTGNSSTLNMVMTCTDEYNCTFSSDFIGRDGNTHRVKNFNLSGDAESGYTGTVTFQHSTYGEVTVTITSAVTYGNCGNSPDGGSISFTSSNGSSSTITFANDCTVSGDWNNSTDSGNF